MERATIRPEIENLLNEVVGDITVEEIASIVDKHKHNLNEGLALLEKYDKKIGGKGIHNINRPDGHGGWTGNYHIEDRPIYRPIQYVEASIYEENLEWETRNIVEMSCLHVAGCLERYCGDPLGRMFGQLLYSKKGRALPKFLWDNLNIVRENLYNPSKHYIPDYEDHLFTEVEAITTYFICRKLGLELLKLIP